MLPVVIVGKGISALHVPQSGAYHVACISEAVRLCDRCEWLAVNDVAAYRQLTREDIVKAERLLLPTHLHCDPRADAVKHYAAVIADEEDRGVELSRVDLYQLPSAAVRHPEFPDFGKCWSTSESLVAFLTHKGYRRFITVGIERDTAKYHPLFDKSIRTTKSRGHFCTNWIRTQRRVKDVGGKFIRWGDSEFA